MSTTDNFSNGAFPPLTSPSDIVDVDDWDALGTDNGLYGFIGDMSIYADSTANDINGEENRGGGKVCACPDEFSFAHPEIRRFGNNDELKYNWGYDSNGEMMYYEKIALDDDPDNISKDFIEPGTSSSTTTSSMTTLATTTSATTTVASVQISEECAGNLKVPELKNELKKSGKVTGGNKNILFD